MEEPSYVYQSVHKKREIFENLARQNAKASKIQITRAISAPANVVLDVVAVDLKNLSDNFVRSVSEGIGYSNDGCSININTTSDDNYDDIVKSVSMVSGTEQKSCFNSIAMEPEAIFDRISASDDSVAIDHNKNMVSVGNAETDEKEPMCDDDEFGENEARSVTLALAETMNLDESKLEDLSFYEILESSPEYVNDQAEPLKVECELCFDGDNKYVTNNDSSRFIGTEEKNQEYDAASISLPIHLNIGKIQNILEEIITTEEYYVKTLQIGIENYVTYMENNLAMPLELNDKKNQIFGEIEKIYEFHRNQFHPALLQTNYDLDAIIEKFRFFIQQDHFYSYVLYAMNKPKSDVIVHQNKQFFEDRRNSIGDKLGVSSFLMQPIQRLPKYRLLVSEMINEFMKNIDEIEHNVKLKNTFGNLCLTEKELQNVLDVANESISVNDIQFDEIFINIHHQGKFIRCSEFQIYDRSRTKNKYCGKIFLFNKALIYTEYRTTDKQQLIYRGSYDRMHMGVLNDQFESYHENQNKIFIFESKMEQNEFEFNRTNGNLHNWYTILQQILYDLKEEEWKRVKLIQCSTSKIQTNESMCTHLMKHNEPAADPDSYEIGNSTWYVFLN